jgi:hypothetical protein
MVLNIVRIGVFFRSHHDRMMIRPFAILLQMVLVTLVFLTSNPTNTITVEGFTAYRISKPVLYTKTAYPQWSQQQQQQQQQLMSSLMMKRHPLNNRPWKAPRSISSVRHRYTMYQPLTTILGLPQQPTSTHLYSVGEESSSSSSSSSSNWVQSAIAKFRARPGTYLLIPCIAALVGWFTNWLAVQMIFYPISYRGWDLYRPNLEVPLGFLGWQGIIPCKTRIMTHTLVDMVTTQLLSVSGALARLDPRHIASLLSPSLVPLTRDIIQGELLSSSPMTNWIFTGPRQWMNHVLIQINTQFIEQLTIQIQGNAESVFQLRNCVVDQMVANRAKLGQLFRQCGQAELNFLTNSGLWFGFLLGLIQMAVALVWDNPWSLSMYVYIYMYM